MWKSFMIVLVVSLALLFISTGIYAESEMMGTFYVEKVADEFVVTVDLTGLESEQTFIRFNNYGIGRDDLAKRFEDIQAITMNDEELAIIPLDEGKYQVDSQGLTEIRVQYRLVPSKFWWDHHLPVVTENHMYIPIEYFFFEVFSGLEFQDVIYDRVKLHLKNLPEDWQILTTCPINDDGSIEVEDHDSLIHAGTYKLKQIQKNDDIFTVAMNQGFEIDADQYLEDFRKIISYQYDMFGDYLAQEALIVINPAPAFREFFGAGGQGKDQNIIIYSSGLNDSEKSRKGLLSLFAHETFHLWLTRSFEMNESLYWFSEGFTRYQQHRTLLKTGIIDEGEFYQNLTNSYLKFEKVQKNVQVPLVETGITTFGKWEYSRLNYEKGGLVAHLLSKHLEALGEGKSFEGLMKEVHNRLAIPKVPLENDVVISIINEYLGDDQFTQDWILNHQILSVDQVSELKPYILKERLFQFLDPPLYVKVIIILVGLFIIGWVLFKVVVKVKGAMNDNSLESE